MPARKIAALPAVASFAAYGQALLDDTPLGKLVRAGVGEQTIVAMIHQPPRPSALSAGAAGAAEGQARRDDTTSWKRGRAGGGEQTSVARINQPPLNDARAACDT